MSRHWLQATQTLSCPEVRAGLAWRGPVRSTCTSGSAAPMDVPLAPKCKIVQTLLSSWRDPPHQAVPGPVGPGTPRLPPQMQSHPAEAEPHSKGRRCGPWSSRGHGGCVCHILPLLPALCRHFPISLVIKKGGFPAQSGFSVTKNTDLGKEAQSPPTPSWAGPELAHTLTPMVNATGGGGPKATSAGFAVLLEVTCQ